MPENEFTYGLVGGLLIIALLLLATNVDFAVPDRYAPSRYYTLAGGEGALPFRTSSASITTGTTSGFSLNCRRSFAAWDTQSRKLHA